MKSSVRINEILLSQRFPRGLMPGEPFKTNAAITRAPILVDLALQGGGSHRELTWGVLDRLLEEPWLEIGSSGTSAGAMSAAVLADGNAKSGPYAARGRPCKETSQRLPGDLVDPGADRVLHARRCSARCSADDPDLQAAVTGICTEIYQSDSNMN
jgi:predicted acylesterase/phospholipase RssA